MKETGEKRDPVRQKAKFLLLIGLATVGIKPILSYEQGTRVLLMIPAFHVMDQSLYCWQSEKHCTRG
jgi:hypothetical protein